MAGMDGGLDDELLFGPEDGAATVASSQRPSGTPWPVLVVDDDPQVHAMTAVLLRDFDFDGRPFEVVSALSAEEAKAVLAQRPDLPIALLDVVMETEDAGLKLVRHIREELGNRRMRIILRTGQPGQAPERDVIVGYDINDYKAKSELTAQRLFTTLVSGLRAWRDIVTIERNRQGLERILSASAPLFEMRPMRAFVERLVEQIARVVDHGSTPAVLACRPVDRADGSRTVAVVAGLGGFSGCIGLPVADVLSIGAAAEVADALLTQRNLYHDGHCVLVFRTREHGVTVFWLERAEPYTADEHRLLELFCNRVAIGFDNVCLYEELVALNHSLEQRVEERTLELAANQKALILAKERVERALERELLARDRQRQFLGMVSHEFRTPLAIIDSAAQLLAMRAGQVEPEMLERLAVIRSSVQRLTGLIDAHLTDERLQTNALVPERAEVDLADLIANVVRPFRVAYPDREFQMTLAGLPRRAEVDANLIALVLTNLVNNAVKYSGPGEAIHLHGDTDGAMAVIEVTDHGRGIPEPELPRLFDRFFRGSGASGVPGTGIGLHTVQQIVHLHGGAVAVDSTLGKGSTFRVVLPV
ncbi:histidine kinase [Azospirillum sp. TSH7]|nr:histidine kinase [Azospirillum sp. TSH7]PWC69190.1 histidine kinase [Azospirillum sp. TSH20]